ncbi:HDL481Cp [Eremothecium sinecaudum]|uniref:Efficient mitochondria targeting-associated protein 19 n=1 Tax=Eremothecium sinecaudum TaxID=45286 RepID=A0A109UYX6_9SACH|nr:HDL481Cp [Eremothecium sinecaudum]AMD20263.1 HDL481Cp [Eremothecium sinecaudum]
MLSVNEQTFYYVFFILQIPIIVFIDSASVLPEKYHLAPNVLNWYINYNNDFLLYENPIWFQWFVVVDLIFQLPFFIYITRSFNKLWMIRHKKGEKPKPAAQDLWRKMSIALRLYGLNASFTTFICIWNILARAYYPLTGLPMSSSDKLWLLGLYVPYFIIPFRLLFV